MARRDTIAGYFPDSRANNQPACPLAPGTSDSGRRSRCRSLLSAHRPDTKGCTAPLAARCAGSPSLRWGYAGWFRRRGAGVMPVSGGIGRAALGGAVLGVGFPLRGIPAGQSGIHVDSPHPSPVGGCANLRLDCCRWLAADSLVCDCIKVLLALLAIWEKRKAHRAGIYPSLCASGFAFRHKATTPLQG